MKGPDVVRLCLVLILMASVGCSIQMLAPKQTATELRVPIDKARYRCVALSRRRTKEEHFELRFNKHATLNEGELILKGALLERRVAQEIRLMSASPFRSDEFEDLRIVTARMGCDSVFSYREKRIEETSLNFLSIFYPTLIGMFIFPGTNLQMGVHWEVSMMTVDSPKPVMEGQWYGVSKMYHFRPGSYDLIVSRAYQDATIEMVRSGLRSLK